MTAAADAFAASRDRFGTVVCWLDGAEAGRLTHGELEAQLAAAGRELICQLLQDHLDLRAAREERRSAVTGADQVTRSRAEPGHQRPLATVFGQVRVTRIAYRAPGAANLYPADAALNLPAGKHSHGLQRLAAAQAARGSFGDGTEAIRRSAGLRIGKRQVEDLARAAAADADSFYAAARPAAAAPATDVLVVSADGKGIIMRPGSLRPRARRTAAASRAKLATRLTRGEVRHHKRMAEVGAVYDITPAPRAPAGILTQPGPPQPATTPAPAARGKWLTASIAAEIRHVIAAVFDEAERRDPGHTRPWIALVDGNPHQIRHITAEATRRDAPVTILIDFIHVLEYLWQAAWALHREADPAAETWVAAHARAILDGQARQVAAAIRAAASTAALTGARHAAAAKAARYLDTKHPYLGYPRALTAGWPISTGVIEGACRYLVKDRMDITGARWSVPGAEAILKLRALTANGDFDTYWTHHLQQEQHRNHHTRYLNTAMPRAA